MLFNSERNNYFFIFHFKVFHENTILKNDVLPDKEITCQK